MSENDLGHALGPLSRYRYMFPLESAERRQAYVWLRGWIPGFAELCQQIDALLGPDKRNFRWTRVREKFGAPSLAYQMDGKARFAFNMHRPHEVLRVECATREAFDDVAIEIHERILQREVLLRSQCIICGAPATITSAQGPWASLCAVHRAAVLPINLDDPMGPVWMAARVGEDEVFGLPGV